MFDTVKLTEEEDTHIAGWRCPECQKRMLELAMDRLTRSNDNSGFAD
jgi:hypothetical protein